MFDFVKTCLIHGHYFTAVTDTKQHFAAVKYAKLIKQYLLFLPPYDEKNDANFVKKQLCTGWEGTESANV